VLTLWSRRSLGSNLKHFWLACACSPVYKNAPATMRAELDGLPIWAHDGTIPPRQPHERRPCAAPSLEDADSAAASAPSSIR
jgi:hypothetical protein